MSWDQGKGLERNRCSWIAQAGGRILPGMPHASPLNVVAAIYSDICDLLNERQRRLLLAAGARALGRGGQSAVAEAVGVHHGSVNQLGETL